MLAVGDDVAVTAGVPVPVAEEEGVQLLVGDWDGVPLGEGKA